MSLATPAGPLALAKTRLATTLADCAAFREIVGAEDSSQALAKIYFDALPRPEGGRYAPEEFAALRPWAMISRPDVRGFRMERLGANHTWGDSGSLWLHIEIPVEIDGETEEPRPFDELIRDFENQIGELLENLSEACHDEGGDYLAAHAIACEVGPTRSAEDEAKQRGDHLFVVLSFAWGGR